MAIVDALEGMPEDALKAAVANLATENRKLRRMFLDTASMPIQRALREMPEAAAIDPTDHDIRAMRAEYRKREAAFDTTPFDPTGEQFRLYEGGVTIWSGYPGGGKTTLLRQIVCHLLQRGRGVYVASLEERPDDALIRLMMTAAASTDPSDHACQWFLDAYGERLRLWGMVGLAKADLVMASIRATAREGIRHAIVDSLTCLDVGASDWDGQRGLANELASLARSTGMHIHLVAHPRKPSQNGAVPDLADVAGSSDLVRLADNVLFVRRSPDTESSRFEDATPMQILVRKQRHGTGMCGKIEGYFHRAHRQYQASQWWQGPTRYLPDDAYAPVPAEW